LLVGAVMGLALPALGVSCAGDSTRNDDGDPNTAALGQSIQSQGVSTFWVVLRDKADVRAAHKIKDRNARGSFVVDHLKNVARQSQSGVIGYLNSKGVAHRPHWITNAIRVEADAKIAKALAARPDVETLLPDVQFRIPPPATPAGPTPAAVDWNIMTVRADEAWATFGTGEGIVIGSIDSGVDFTHEALVAQYRGNVGGTFDHNYSWWDPSRICGPPGSPPCDNYGHGTHTMGTMVGGDAFGPLPMDIGVAPGARWITAKGCEYDTCSTEALLSSAEFMLAPTDTFGSNPDPGKRPHIINNSWGGGPGDPFFRDVVLAWRAAGIFPVFSAGNAGPSCGSAGSPGDYPEAFSVGATDIGDYAAWFSSRGPSFYGPMKPEISAPGLDVFSSIPGGYGYGSGTSMAAPHVAGAIALVWSSAPSLIGDIAATSELLRATAMDHIDYECGGDADGDPNNVYGEGRLDAFAAVQAAPRIAGTLVGRVTSVDSGLPIASATVRAIRVDDSAMRTVKSDVTGQYSLKLAIDPAPGPEPYSVEAAAFGFVGIDAAVDIWQDETTTQDFSLVEAPRFSLTGTVWDEAARPVSGAVVRLLDTPIAAVTTGADGTYAFADVPQGAYELSVGERCHDSVQENVALDASRAVEITLSTHYDTYGYHCEAIPLDYVVTTTEIGLGGDDAAVLQALPFAFSFYGRFHDGAYVSTNGFLSFQEDAAAAYVNSPIPDPMPPNEAIYALWDDLALWGSSVRADVYGSAPSRVWIVEYPDVYLLSDGTFKSFEIKLFEGSGDIEAHYLGVPGSADGQSASIGIENADGTVGLQYSYNEPVLREGKAIRFVPPPMATVTGHITDANDGLAIVGAPVRALSGGGTVTEARTDVSGAYWLYLGLGDYTIEAAPVRYGAGTFAVALTQDDAVVTHDFSLPTPRAVVAPSSLEVIVPLGSSRARALSLSNTGTLAMTWELRESAAAHSVAAQPGNGQWLSQSSSGVSPASNLVAGGVAHPASYRWQPLATATGNVLVYTDDVLHPAPDTYVDQALQHLGMPYTAHYDADFAGFLADLSAGGWSLVIIDNEAYYPDSAMFSAVQSYVAGGGKLVMTTWALAGVAKEPLWTTLGITWRADDFDPPDPVHWWLRSHPVFTTPHAVPEFTDLTGGFYFLDGQHVDPHPGFTALAGYTASPTANEAALVLGNSSRTVFKSFLDGTNNADLNADGTPDAVELWENLIIGLQQGFFTDVPWLSEAPASGTVLPGQTITTAITFNAAGLTAGVYEASLHVLTDSGREPTLLVPVRMIVPAYYAAVNAGGGAYTDLSGEPWDADRWFVAGGFGYMNSKAPIAVINGDIAGTEDDDLFRDLREDPWEYRFDAVPPGVYRIELGFAEPKKNSKVNARLFDVIVENTLVLPSHDIVYEVGSHAADMHAFTAKVTDGQLNIRLLARKNYLPPVINAVRVMHAPDL